MNLLPQYFVVSWVSIMGLLIGSFLNVVIYRVPAKVSLMGRSHCPKCDHQIRAYDNIPVFAWILLRGKCRDCRATISVRYPLIEGFHGLAWGILSYHFGLSAILPVVLIAFSISLALAMIDFDTMLLPQPLVYAMWLTTVVGMVAVSLHRSEHTSLLRAVYSGLAWGGFYFILWVVTKGRGLGYGDVKLAPALGALAGYFSFHSAVIGFFGAFIVGGIPAAILMAVGVIKRGARIPYGPMLIAGTWLGILYGDQLANLYLSISGLK